MTAVKAHSRIYLLVNEQPRAFWWFRREADQSVYFGSANSKRFRVGTTGQSTTSASIGTPIVPELGRPMTPEELAGKISIHGSGIVNLATTTDGRRDRHVIKPPREGFESLPLILVLPMCPAMYPVSEEMVTHSDIVIPADGGQPFGLLFYLKRVEGDPSVMQILQKRRPGGERFDKTFGDAELVVWKYRPKGYNVWLEREGEIIATTSDKAAEPSWPFVD